jgi:transmembrane sensor
MSRASDINNAAAQWLIRLEGPTSSGTWDSFQAWESDPRNRAAFIRLRAAWHRADRLKSLRPADGTVDCDLLAKTKTDPASLAAGGPRSPRGEARTREDSLMPERRRVFAIAAAIATTGIIAWFGSYHLGWKTYETGVGGREKIELADGSTVDLNTDTELNVRMGAARRDIMLGHGEALFHVAHDSARPFYVSAAGTVVRAVGTEFSVRIRDAQDVDVLVAEGRVAVGAPGTEANFENPALLEAAPKVSAGEAADVHGKSVSVSHLPPKDITRKLAWTDGHLAFRGETLGEAVQEFNRYNQRQITIVDPSIRTVQIGGVFQTTDPDSFVEALHRSFGFRMTIEGNNIRLSRER